MNLAQLNHAFNWWNKNGFVNLVLLEQVLQAKESNPVAKHRHLSIQKTINANK